MAIVSVPRGTYENKPPNTFSSGDIFRIIANNVTTEERLHVLYFFLVIVPVTGFLTDILEAITLIFKPANIIIKILKFLKLFDNIAQRISPLDAALLLMVLPEEPRKEAKGLLDVLEREFLVD